MSYSYYNSKTRQRAVKMLQRSVKLIEQNGWCTGEERKLVGEQLHYCAVGALNESAKNFPSKDAWISRSLAQSVLDNIALDKGFDGIVELNDHAKTDKRKVLRVFNSAIEGLTSV